MARYVEILFRFKARFALLLVALPALVAGTVIVLFPSYKAVAQLWVDDPSYFGGTTPTGWSQYLTPAQNESDSLNQLLGTRAFSSDLDVKMQDDIGDTPLRNQAVGNAKITMTATGSHLLVMTATCDQKWICIVVLNRAVEVLKAEQIQTEQDNAKAGTAYVNVQLSAAKTDATNAQDALKRYIALHPGAKVDQNSDPNSIQDPELSRLAADVQQKNSRVNDLNNQLARDQTIVSASTAVIQAGPAIIDPPIVTRGFPIGDGSSLRKGGMFAGASLAIGLIYLFLIGLLDKSLRDPREIEHRFKVPVVTSIPELLPSERF